MNRAVFTVALVLVLTGATRPAASESASAVFDSTGRFAGLWAGTSPDAIQTNLHSLRGFRFAVNGDGRIGASVDTTDIGGALYSRSSRGLGTAVWYTTSDCTGAGYLRISGSTNGLLPGGVVVRLATVERPLVYVTKAPIVTEIVAQSMFEGVCTTLPPTPIPGVQFLANDPSVTGVSEPNFSPPLRLEVVPLSALNDVFSDGFETRPAQT